MNKQRLDQQVDIYSASLSRVYDREFGALAIAEWRQGICSLLRQEPIDVGTVLDLGAGTGIGAIALRELGKFSFVGIDSSPHMARYVRPGLYERYFIGNILDCWSLADCSPSIVVSGFDTLNYLTRDEFELFLRRTSRRSLPLLLCFDTLSRVDRGWSECRKIRISQRSSLLIEHWSEDASSISTRTRLETNGHTRGLLRAEQYIYPEEFIAQMFQKFALTCLSEKFYLVQKGVYKAAYLLRM